jgi:hypothetical protein
MSRKNSGMPALYELMGRRGTTGPPLRMREDPPPSDALPGPDPGSLATGGSWLSPGRMLRLPVGYILLGVAGAVALMVGAYVLGFRKAEVVVTKDGDRDLLLNIGTIDPLKSDESTRGNDPTSTTRGGPSGASPFPSISMAPAANSAPASSENPAWGPVFSDPRQDGLNYFVLMETSRDGAERVARFCRENGLETYAVGRSSGNHRVIVLPGFETSQRSTDAVRALEALIHRVGELWRQQKGGNSDFRDKYPSLYKK